MSTRLNLQHGSEHMHKDWGRVMFIHCHPQDGASLVVERQSTTDPDDDDHVLATCESSDLGPALPDSAWPYLGFTSEARSRAQSLAWGERHNFVETPPGSWRWVWSSTGLPVDHDVWLAAWRQDFCL